MQDIVWGLGWGESFSFPLREEEGGRSAAEGEGV